MARSTSPLRNGWRVDCFHPSSTSWNALPNACALFPLHSSFKHLHTQPAAVREPQAPLSARPKRDRGQRCACHRHGTDSRRTQLRALGMCTGLDGRKFDSPWSQLKRRDPTAPIRRLASAWHEAGASERRGKRDGRKARTAYTPETHGFAGTPRTWYRHARRIPQKSLRRPVGHLHLRR